MKGVFLQQKTPKQAELNQGMLILCEEKNAKMDSFIPKRINYLGYLGYSFCKLEWNLSKKVVISQGNARKQIRAFCGTEMPRIFPHTRQSDCFSHGKFERIKKDTKLEKFNGPGITIGSMERCIKFVEFISNLKKLGDIYLKTINLIVDWQEKLNK